MTRVSARTRVAIVADTRPLSAIHLVSGEYRQQPQLPCQYSLSSATSSADPDAHSDISVQPGSSSPSSRHPLLLGSTRASGEGGVQQHTDVTVCAGDHRC
ncbi:hypothetical protein GDO78_022947 [Eleutherodactylus coqui]|uniref:Uncharacterized protein n=1 Tax=Eleutherodactylus coqui TaxID=57060 RepID=A0A8J6BG04_ELECQ|nr:hypothetical protein GDO78_022947 [Eleutherodactylus coqui]